MKPTVGHSAKVYMACLGAALVLAAGLHVFSGYTATYGTLALESSRELSGGEMLLLGSGNFIANWFIAVVAVLLSAALVTALVLGRRVAREAP